MEESPVISSTGSCTVCCAKRSHPVLKLYNNKHDLFIVSKRIELYYFSLDRDWTNATLTVLTLRVPVTEGGCSHVTQADGAFATAVHEYIALVWMALSSCDYFRQFLHVGGLDVYNI